MDRCTHEVRAQYWKRIIQACQQRPADQSAKQWMKENGILEQSYYKWQQKFRKEIYEIMNTSENVSSATVKNNITFAEIPVKPNLVNSTLDVSSVPAAVIKTSSLTIAISNEISEELLYRIMREASVHA